MKTLAAFAFVFLSGCLSAVTTAISLGTSAYASYDAYARATQPPEKIYPVTKRGRINGIVYEDDERIPYWCAAPKTRARIAEHCAARDERTQGAEAAREEAARQAGKDKAVSAENEKIRADVIKTAKQSGLTVLFDVGLGMSIVQVRSGEKRLGDFKKTLVELFGDGNFVATQVVNQNNVLFKDGSTDAIVWLKDYAKGGGKVTWLEGARLTNMEAGYVLIKGTKEYPTLIGTKQAIVIEAVF